MTTTLTLQNDAQAVVTLVAEDGIGAPIALPAGGTVTVADATVATATLNADNTVTVLPVAASGSTSMTYVNGDLTCSADIVITVPTAAAVAFDIADAVISAKPALVAASTAADPAVAGTASPAV